jgi:protein arginine kinase
MAVIRNEAVLPFPHGAGEGTLTQLRDRVVSALEAASQPGDWDVHDLGELSAARLAFLTERGLMTPGFKESHGAGRALAVYREGRASVEINGTDHLHILGWRSGDALSELWATLDAIDDLLEQEVTYAFDEHWGYLTAQPKEAGTGMRAHVTMHLPGLFVAGRLGPLTVQLAKQGLIMMPLWDGAGGLFQISNRAGKGVPELQAIEAVGDAARWLGEKERAVRKTLYRESPIRVRDYIGRALGVAQQAWAVGVGEGLSLVSAILVGADMGIIDAPDLNSDAAFALMRRIHPGHLSLEEPQLCGSLDEARLDEVRAAVLRTTFAGVGASQ